VHDTLKVSIIDDDDSVRTATGSLLRSFGWEVRLYESAEAFLRSADTEPTDCIISDVQMPGMSGLELQHHMALRHDTTPLIFISAFYSEAVSKKAIAAGALGFLRKPVDGQAIAHYLDVLANARK
jgi:FixJ family two-component response regulator